MKSGFDAVPIEIEEAARDRWRQSCSRSSDTSRCPWRLAATGAAALFALLLAWDEFFYALLYTNDTARQDAAGRDRRFRRRPRHRLRADFGGWPIGSAAAGAYRILPAEIAARRAVGRKRQGMSMHAPTDTPRSGLDLLEAEMARQHADALASLRANAEMASADRGQHHARAAGCCSSAWAPRTMPTAWSSRSIAGSASTRGPARAAELMHTPPPAMPRTTIFVSQSGESGEIVELLKAEAAGEDRFGMTLDASSTLGRTLPCLVGAGGSEVAFAATRSLVVTLALHAALLAALGHADQSFGRQPATPCHSAARRCAQRIGRQDDDRVRRPRRLQGRGGGWLADD